MNLLNINLYKKIIVKKRYKVGNVEKKNRMNDGTETEIKSFDDFLQSNLKEIRKKHKQEESIFNKFEYFNSELFLYDKVGNEKILLEIQNFDKKS